MTLCLDQRISWHCFAYRHKDFDLSHFLLNVPVDIPIILREEYPVISRVARSNAILNWAPNCAFSRKTFSFHLEFVTVSLIEDILVSRGQIKAPELPSLHHPLIKSDEQSKQTNSHRTLASALYTSIPSSSFQFSFFTIPCKFYNYRKQANTDC